jgi:hypothetical protein
MNQLSQMLMMGAAAKTGFNPNTPFGTFIEGGYFAGVINQGGSKWAIIVAPKASGQSSTALDYITINPSARTAAQTLNNGFDATAALVSFGNHTAANFCASLTIGGFSDWYLPARDELELCYRNLKPTTNTNFTATRETSDYTYPEGNDVSGDTMGRNRNSDPAGSAYTSGNPIRTSVAAFQDGGTEAFAASGSYWSSTEFSKDNAWRQGFTTGGQSSANKGNSFNLVRAVRRVFIS